MNGYDRYLDFQYGMSGDFYKALWEAIARADYPNTERLRLGFPEEVDAYRTWTRVGPQALLAKVSKSCVLRQRFIDEYKLKED